MTKVYSDLSGSPRKNYKLLEVLLSEVLKKPQKTLDDAQFIYAKIRSFQFFESFFAQNLKKMDHASLMALCKGFQYEKYPIGTFIFKKGEISNNKFYVILSGKVAIVVPKKVPIPAQRRSRILLDPTPTPIQKPPMKRDLSLKILTTKNRQKLGHHVERSVGRSPKVGSETPVEERKGNKPVLRREKTMWGPFSLLYSKDDSQEKGILSERKEVDSLLLKEVPQTKVVVSKEVEEELDLTDEQKFQEYTAKFGKIVRFMETGESFGDLALKDNIPRQATVVCNTDCELLVISKHQFEIIFLAKEREKEEFLRSIFPFLKTLSTINFNNILYSFQTEVHTKGNYLTKEGIPTTKNTKFFLIQHGECVVEKNVLIEVDNPYDRSKPISQNTQPIQVAVIGQGMIAGEEIIINGNNYNYSVKALSENVIVLAVTKAEFDSRFFKDFQDYMIAMYLKKKKQRDIAVENVKKEYESKASEIKAKNIYTVQNTRIKDIIKKPALQSLSKYMHREHKTVDSMDPVRQLILSKNNANTHLDTSMLFTRVSADEESFHQVEGSPNTPQNSLKIKRGLIKSIDASNIRRQNVECKLEYLNKLPDPPKNNDIPITPKNLEAMKFFGSTNPKKLRSAKSFSGKVSNFSSTVNHANVAEANKDLAWSIFKDPRRNVKDFEQGNEEKESLPLLKVKSGNSTPNPTINVQENKQQGSDPQSPLISVQSWSIQRSQTAHSGKGQRYKTMTPKAPIQGEIIGKIYSSSGPTSPREPITSSHSSTPKSKGGENDKLYKLSQFNKERVHNETFYHFKEQEFACNTQEFEAELEKEPPVKFNFETTCADEPKIQKVSSVHTNDLFSKLSGHKSPHNARLHITKEWRQKVFKKTHQRHGSAGLNPTGLEFFSSTLKSPSNKK